MDPLSLMKHCTLCPRECGVDRLAGQAGFCGETGANVRAARAALHFWEEPCLSGERGSGTIFFTGCNLRCVFCQNEPISRGRVGFEADAERLARIMLNLQAKGAHNVNFVTPTHYVPQILCSVPLAREMGLTIPIVWNCSGYEKPETLRLLEGTVNVYLPDFKYCSSDVSSRYSACPDYFDRALPALREMVRQTGSPRFDEDGMLLRGTCVRILLLPGLIADAKRVLDVLFDKFENRVIYSLMSQYTPMPTCSLPELQRKVTKEEYEEFVSHAEDLGIENGFVQEGEAASESFIPEFRGEGIIDF